MVVVARLREDEAQRELGQAVERELDAVRQAAVHEQRIGRMRAARSADDVDDWSRHASYAMREEIGRRAQEVSAAALRGVVEERRAAVVAAVMARRMAYEVATRASQAASAAVARAEGKELDDQAMRRRREEP
jgi:hypothetical protein